MHDVPTLLKMSVHRLNECLSLFHSTLVRTNKITFLLRIHATFVSATEHVVVAVPVAVVAFAGGFLVSRYLTSRCCKKSQVNTSICKDSPKVVHSFDMEDIGTKAVYCRCWKSKKVSLLDIRCCSSTKKQPTSPKCHQ